ncbi:MAG: DNA repair protein RecN [Treponema sp.]
MIESISIKNIALIDELSIDFSHALTVLTGETGAGKSILIGALSFLLGGKAHTDIIRTGAAEASVAAVFYVPETHAAAHEWLKKREIEPDDNRILLRRTIKINGRMSAWIQNTPVSRTELEAFTAFLVDIHGQHDHQSLFKTSEHRRFLDSYAGLTEDVIRFSGNYTKLAECKAQLEKIEHIEKERMEKLDYLSFVQNEIDQAQLQPHEDEQLETEEAKLCQYEKLYEQTMLLKNTCRADQGIVPLLKKLRHIADSIADIDPQLGAYTERIENTYYEMLDISEFFSGYLDKLVFDPERLSQVQERLSSIAKLKKKYGDTIESILSFREQAVQQLDTLAESEHTKTALQKRISELSAALYTQGTALSQQRKKAALDLEQQIQTVLQRLGMPKVQFKVQVSMKAADGTTQTASPFGFDLIEFLISANPGEPVKPLNKIASGGEISRIMLALKTILAAADEADTLVFDEIDTGIGGEIAHTLAKHLKQLGQEKQILCITHLAVIAAAADNHIKIRKVQSGDSSRTEAEIITEDDRIDEIARMLAGDEASAVSRTHAQELLAKYRTVLPCPVM